MSQSVNMDPPTTPKAPPASSGVMDLLLPGDIIAERYEIIDIIGQGGFGVVYQARQIEMGQLVAIKTLRRSLVDYEEAEQRFRREALLARHLQHPNTIRLFDFGESEQGILYICMEYLEGQTLEELVEEMGYLSLPQVHRIAIQIAKSLTEAHNAGIIHRDLKPSNVFVTEMAGEPHFVKVLDFGIAKVTQAWDEAGYTDKLTRTGTAFGSPAYMSPEQVRGTTVAPASDVYSFGLILIEALTGQQVVTGNSPFDVAVKQAGANELAIPEWLEQSPMGPIIRRCILKDASQRYSNAEELLASLEELPVEALESYLSKLEAEVDLPSLITSPLANPTDPTASDLWPSNTTRTNSPVQSKNLVFLGAVIAVVLTALVLVIVVNRAPAPAEAPVENAPTEEKEGLDFEATRLLVDLADALTASSISGCILDQELPRPALHPAKDKPIPSPVLPQLGPTYLTASLHSASLIHDLIALPGVVDEDLEITIENEPGRALAEGAFIAAFGGAIPLETVTIQLSSRPRAWVYLQDQENPRGKTPISLEFVKGERQMRFKLEASGYRSATKTVTVNQSYQFVMELRRRAKRVKVVN